MRSIPFCGEVVNVNLKRSQSEMKSRELTINLLAKSPEDLLEWVKLARSQKVDLPEDFSWYSLASSIISRIKTLIHERNLECVNAWFKIVNEIYDHVASGNPNSSEAEALHYEIMYVRAALIMNFGISKADPLLNEDQLLAWFFHDLNVPLNTARQKSDDWQNLKQQNKVRWLRDSEERNDGNQKDITTEDLKKLRKIKNKLAILKPLYQHKLIENRELGEWVALMHRLP
jgi:hypothetical protein